MAIPSQPIAATTAGILPVTPAVPTATPAFTTPATQNISAELASAATVLSSTKANIGAQIGNQIADATQALTAVQQAHIAYIEGALGQAAQTQLAMANLLTGHIAGQINAAKATLDSLQAQITPPQVPVTAGTTAAIIPPAAQSPAVAAGPLMPVSPAASFCLPITPTCEAPSQAAADYLAMLQSIGGGTSGGMLAFATSPVTEVDPADPFNAAAVLGDVSLACFTGLPTPATTAIVQLTQRGSGGTIDAGDLYFSGSLTTLADSTAMLAGSIVQLVIPPTPIPADAVTQAIVGQIGQDGYDWLAGQCAAAPTPAAPTPAPAAPTPQTPPGAQQLYAVMCLDSDGTVYQTLVSDPTIAALWPWSAGPYPTSLQFRMAFYQAFRGFSAPDPADKTISAWTIHDAGATDVTGLSQADYLARVNQVYAGMALVGYLAPDLTTVVNQAPPCAGASTPAPAGPPAAPTAPPTAASCPPPVINIPPCPPPAAPIDGGENWLEWEMDPSAADDLAALDQLMSGGRFPVFSATSVFDLANQLLPTPLAGAPQWEPQESWLALIKQPSPPAAPPAAGGYSPRYPQ